MTRLLLLVCSVLLWPFSAPGDSAPTVGKLFVGLTYRYTYLESHFLGSDRLVEQKASELPIKGSFWAVQAGGDIILVTAAHVLGINWQPAQIDGHIIDNKKLGFLKGVTTRVLLGTLAYTPSRIGYVKGVNDAAFLLPKDQRMLNTVTPVALSDTPPISGERVRIVGYPGTPYPQTMEMIVTDVHENQGFFILNQPVDGGYSGGVVLNAAGKAYGVIVNTDPGNKQTTVLRITPATIQNIKWEPVEKALNREF